MNKLDYLKNKLQEVNEEVKGSYINRIMEISNCDFLFITSRSNKKNLLLSINSSSPFFSLTSKKNNSTLSSLFLQNLKYKLLNSCLVDCSIFNNDSIIDFKFIKTNDTYDRIEYHLLFELFKGNSNLVLLEENKIVLAFRYHSLETSHPLILNTFYIPPRRIELIKEIDVEKEKEKENSYISSLDNKYLNQKFNSLIHQLKRKRKSLENKREALEKELETAKENLKYKDYGDYFLTIMDQIKKGDSYFIYEDKKIPLKENYSINDNMQYLYKVYKKAKNTISMVSKFIDETKKDISYIDSILSLQDIYNEDDYNQLILELRKNKLIKVKQKVKEKDVKSVNPYFILYNGVKISFGKNSIQNNELTFKLANKNDTFLHIDKTHGSHVVISKPLDQLTDDELEFALELTLYLAKKDDGTILVSSIKDCKKSPTLGEVNLLKYETYYVKRKRDDVSKYLENISRF